jgi:phosphatidylserine decarboxylase
MKHSGKATKAALKLILLTLVAGGILWGVAALAAVVGTIVSAVALPVLLILWILFSLFTIYFFRDPAPRVPKGPNLVVSPAHGKVDVIDTTTEPQFMGGECRRISVFLSVFDVHIQNAPVTGKVALVKYTMGQFLNAMRAESTLHNENVLLGFEASDPPGQKVGVRLIAGVIARRIVPFVQQGEPVARGERISLIQFGSRADIYLPLKAALKVKIGDHVTGGQTVLAVIEGP